MTNVTSSTCYILGESLAGEGVSVEERVHLPLHVVTQRLRLRALGGEERPGFRLLLLCRLMLAILRSLSDTETKIHTATFQRGASGPKKEAVSK